MEGYSARAEEPRLGPLARSGMLLLGACLLLLAWPVGFAAAVFSGGGHGSPFDGSAAEAVFGAAMLAIPVLMIVLGIACLAARDRFGVKVATMIALLIPADLALAVTAASLAMRSDPPVAYPVQRQLPSITSENIVIGPGPTHVGVACSAAGDECVTSTTTYSADGEPTTTRKVEKIDKAKGPAGR
jgi:hypothetical protein